jgi:hypothetical protein
LIKNSKRQNKTLRKLLWPLFMTENYYSFQTIIGKSSELYI